MSQDDAILQRKFGKKRLANDCILTKLGDACRKQTKTPILRQAQARIVIGDLWIQPLNIPATIGLQQESEPVMQPVFTIMPKFDFLWL